MATPITITSGGTYTGDWSAVTVSTTEPVILEKGTLSGTITTTVAAYLTVRQCKVTGPDTWDSPRWLVVNQGWDRLEVSNCSIENTRGIELWPNTRPNPVTLVTRNYHRNPKGNGITPVGNFIQLRQIWGSPKWGPPVNPNPGLIEISWNEIWCEYQKSNPEDVFSIYKTARTRIHDNLINGQSKPSQFSGSSQNSITIDPADELDLLYDNQVIGNFVIDAFSIGMFGGNNNLFQDNYVVSDGYIADSGVKMPYGYSGMFISNKGSGNKAINNHVGYIGSQGRVDYQQEGGMWTGNVSLPGPITRQTELDHIAMWRKRVSDAGITIGVGGGTPPVTELALTKISETSTKITLGWTPVPGAAGYRYQSATQAPKYSHTWDPNANKVTFSKAAWYKVEALSVEATGNYPPSTPPPSNFLLDEQWNSIDPAKWQKKYWFNGDTYYHDQAEQIEALRDANAFVSNGVLNLVAKREDVTDFQGRAKKFTSGMVQTNGIQGVTPTPGPSFTYGKFEARIKAAPGPGMWSCFWLCDAGWPSTCPGEIDIVEIVGTNIEVANQNLHAAGTSGTTGKGHDTNQDLSAGFHVYGLEWRQSFLAWSVDGVETFRYTGPAIPTSPHYIFVNLQVGGPGSWAGTPPLDGSTLPSAMQVDWLKVST